MILCLKVEILPGTDIEKAAQELCSLAQRLNINIETKFNGIPLFVRPVSNWRNIVKQYYSTIEKRKETNP